MSILKFGLFDIIKEGNLLCKPGMKCRLSNIKPGRYSAAHKILLRPSREACTLHLAAKIRIWCKLGGAAPAEEPHCKLSFMALHCLAPFLLSASLKHLSIYLLIICFPGPASVMPQSGGRGEVEVWEQQEGAGGPAARQELVKYGELVILGYNGSLPQGDKGRRRSKFVLYRRSKPNGVSKSKHYVVKTPQTSQAILDTKQHSISYTLNRNQAVIVEYQQDDSTDMFQVGRSSESPIDFVVMDTIPGNRVQDPSKAAAQSTISRFACRILVGREEAPVTRIFAAGFDSSRNIFLGEKATKWETEQQAVDGLTTNGVLIMHPQTSFCGADDPNLVTAEVSHYHIQHFN